MSCTNFGFSQVLSANSFNWWSLPAWSWTRPLQRYKSSKWASSLQIVGLHYWRWEKASPPFSACQISFLFVNRKSLLLNVRKSIPAFLRLSWNTKPIMTMPKVSRGDSSIFWAPDPFWIKPYIECKEHIPKQPILEQPFSEQPVPGTGFQSSLRSSSIYWHGDCQNCY